MDYKHVINLQKGPTICIMHIGDLVLVGQWINKNKFEEICIMAIQKNVYGVVLYGKKPWFSQKSIKKGYFRECFWIDA
jgi:hypothetical protein